MKFGILFLVVLCRTPVLPKTADNVLLVLNEANPVSVNVGSYYVQKRGIRQPNILRMKVTADDSIPLQDFERQIDSPIASRLMRNITQDPIALEKSPDALIGMKRVLGYHSWGSNDPSIRMLHIDLEFVPGALEIDPKFEQIKEVEELHVKLK